MNRAFPHRRLLLAAAVAAAFPAWPGPVGERISAGQGAVTRNGTVTTITQGSSRLAIDWQAFGIAAGETVNFVQPGAGAIALNRVTGMEASQIHGALNANGQVFLLNPNGVLFGRTAQVSVGGLLASTLSLSDADFLAGRTVLRGTGGAVRNEGTLRAADGGYVALVGGEVRNTGTVAAPRGSVALAAGRQVTLDFAGDGLLRLAVDEGVLGALVDNGGIVQADGGAALLTARAADALAGTVVNNTGLVQARRLEDRGGTIQLLGGFEGGTVQVGGTLDVSAPQGGAAGFVETSGARVRIQPGARVLAGPGGRWLVDPTDITIDAAAAATISAALDAGTGVEQDTNGGGGDAGDITVLSPIQWTGTGWLTLRANRNVAIQAAIDGPNGGLLFEVGNEITVSAPVSVGGLYLWQGSWRQLAASLPALNVADFQVAGGSFLRATGGDGSAADPYRIADVYGLQGIGSNTGTLAQHYRLAGDIDAAVARTWNMGVGFRPIGNSFDPFAGRFDGAGHVVRNLHIDEPWWPGVGLFGAVGVTGSVANVGVLGGSFKGFSAGPIAGENAGTLSNVWSDSVVDGYTAGGLVGWNLGTVSDAYATGDVNGSINGGFVGLNEGTITRAWASGNITSEGGAGGFAGQNRGTITVAYATGSVNATHGGAGGFVGINAGTIRDAYATGAVRARLPVFDGIGAEGAGGFFGIQEFGASISRSYATGAVDNDSVRRGGFGGAGAFGTLSGNFYDGPASGLPNAVGSNYNGGVTRRTSAQMLSQSQFGSLDFAGTWVQYEGHTRPLLRAFLTPLTVTANDAARTYDGTSWSGGNGVSYSVSPDANLLGTATFGGAAQGARNAGTYGLTVGGLYSNQQGYLITYAPGTLTIVPKTVTVSGVTAADKVYDGGTAAALDASAAVVDGIVGGDAVGFAAAGLSGTFSDRNVGTGKTVTLSGGALTGGSAGNYVLAPATGTTTASITPASLSLTGMAARDKVYDGTTAAVLDTTAAGLAGVVAGDAVTVSTAGVEGRFSDRNAGAGKAVTVTGAALEGADAGNYVLAAPAPLTADITPAPLAVAADDQAKVAGTPDPALTFRVAGLVAGDTLDGALTGGLQRAPGEAAGPYAITQGTLAAVGGNYAIGFTPGTLVVTAAPLPPDPQVPPVSPPPAGGAPDAAALQAAIPLPQPEAAPPLACVAGPKREAAAASCEQRPLLAVVEGGVRLPAAAARPQAIE